MTLTSISMPNAQTSPSGSLFQAALMSASELIVPVKQTGSPAKDQGTMSPGVRDFGAKDSNAGANARSSAERNEGALTAPSEPSADTSAIQTASAQRAKRQASAATTTYTESAVERPTSEGSPASSVLGKEKHSSVAGNAASAVASSLKTTVDSTIPMQATISHSQSIPHPVLPSAQEETASPSSQPGLNEIAVAESNAALNLVSAPGQVQVVSSMSASGVHVNAPFRHTNWASAAYTANAGNNGPISSAGQNTTQDSGPTRPVRQTASTVATTATTPGSAAALPSQLSASTSRFQAVLTGASNTRVTADVVMPSTPGSQKSNADLIAMMSGDKSQSAVSSGLSDGVLKAKESTLSAPQQKAPLDRTVSGLTWSQSPTSTASPVANASSTLPPAPTGWSYTSMQIVRNASQADASDPAQDQDPQLIASQATSDTAASIRAGVPMRLTDATGSLASNPVLTMDAPVASTGLYSFDSTLAQPSGGMPQTPADLSVAAALPVTGISNAAGSQVVAKAAQKESSYKTDAKSSDLDGLSNADASKAATTTSSAHEASAHASQNGGQAAQDSQGDSSQPVVAASKTLEGGTVQQTVGVAHIASHDTAIPHRAPESADQTAPLREQRDFPGSTHPDGSEAVTSSGIDAAKLIQRMGETEMRVGMRSSEFGEISIRTSVSQQQMLTQISLDHSDLSQAISAHVSATQAKLGDDHGLHALIEVNSQGASLSSGSGESASREQKAFTSSSRSQSTAVLPEVEKAANVGAMTSVGSEHRLDIRA